MRVTVTAMIMSRESHPMVYTVSSGFGHNILFAIGALWTERTLVFLCVLISRVLWTRCSLLPESRLFCVSVWLGAACIDLTATLECLLCVWLGTRNKGSTRGYCTCPVTCRGQGHLLELQLEPGNGREAQCCWPNGNWLVSPARLPELRT